MFRPSDRPVGGASILHVVANPEVACRETTLRIVSSIEREERKDGVTIWNTGTSDFMADQPIAGLRLKRRVSQPEPGRAALPS
jgi:hypothetical protein